ncbi:tetratricopeptide repeat protein [Candidatus Izemoplasma sp. B36]|uniref:tetratricopeptide repeat protein n=1 Tax=Candidatus Izemoplasma sp. B36 TaxID=3242468 RepID=UPI003558BBDB
MNKTDRRIEDLYKQFNKISDLVSFYEKPTVSDYLEFFINNHISKLMDVKNSDIIAVIFILAYDEHIEEFEDQNFYENILRTLRVWSRRDDIFYLSIHMYDNMGFNKLDREKFEEQSLEDSVSYEEVAYDLLKSRNVEILKSLPRAPFKQILGLQKKSQVNYDLRELVDTLSFGMYDSNTFNKVLVYNLLYVSPFSHSTMSLLIDLNDEEDAKNLMRCMINAYEVTHEETLRNKPKDFYNQEDNNEYILALDSLGYLCKMSNDYEEAIIHYEKALYYDDFDRLNIRAALLFPYITTGNLEKAKNIQDELPEESIHKRYMQLYLDFHAGLAIAEVFKKAYQSSIGIMHGIISGTIQFSKLNPEEQIFVNDFYQVMTNDYRFVERLKELL